MMKTTTLLRRILAISVLVLATSNGIAQTPPPEKPEAPAHGKHWKELTPDERIGRRVDMMKKHLDITDAQASRIAAVLHQEQQTLVADRQRVKDATPEQKLLARTQLQKDRLDVKSKVLLNLTPVQLVKADKISKHHRGHMFGEGHHRDHGDRD